MNRVTRDQINSEILDIQYYVFPGTTTTVACVTLRNGYSVTGEAACIDGDEFNPTIGQELALDRAKAKIWGLLAFTLMNQNFRAQSDMLGYCKYGCCPVTRDNPYGDCENKDRAEGTMKTLHNSDVSGARLNVDDLCTWGDPDTFKLICKASSNKEDWMKSTKAMEIPGVGCIVQVTTQQGVNIAEAVCFVPGVRIVEGADSTNGVTFRQLAQIHAPGRHCQHDC